MEPPVGRDGTFIQISLQYGHTCFPIRVRKEDPIFVIHEFVEEIFKISIKQQGLYMEGSDRVWCGYGKVMITLYECGIDDQARIIVAQFVKTGGGGGFDLLSFVGLFSNDEKTIDFDPKAPPWKIVHPGLNLSGTCYNNVCEAYRKRVWVPKNFDTFNIRIESTVAKCVRCGELLINVINCGFYKCLFSIEGKSSSGTSLNIVNREAPDDKFLTFKDVTENQTIQYEYLKIITAPKPESSCNLL